MLFSHLRGGVRNRLFPTDSARIALRTRVQQVFGRIGHGPVERSATLLSGSERPETAVQNQNTVEMSACRRYALSPCNALSISVPRTLGDGDHVLQRPNDRDIAPTLGSRKKASHEKRRKTTIEQRPPMFNFQTPKTAKWERLQQRNLKKPNSLPSGTRKSAGALRVRAA
jgi:hypothetical protein